MSTKELKRRTISDIDSVLTQQYVTFLRELSKEMDIAYEFEDRCEHLDYYLGVRQAFSRAAELFRKHYEDVSTKNPLQ